MHLEGHDAVSAYDPAHAVDAHSGHHEVLAIIEQTSWYRAYEAVAAGVQLRPPVRRPVRVVAAHDDGSITRRQVEAYGQRLLHAG